jgi:hypothetical protein
MRTHTEIIRDAGGWRKVRATLGLPTTDYKVKFWFFRNSIPAEWFQAMAEHGFSTSDELALWKHRKRYLKANPPPLIPVPDITQGKGAA